ncbi:MAG: TIGR00730 family Rossman fold protein [Chloroflexi bacterium]|nr:TIGR00730 family Rossman fold protein [Chloroflexota bacterium]
MHICVFCSSSAAVDQPYVDAAVELGRLLGQHGHSLVYGGSNAGLMGELARAAQAAGARVHGVIPRMMVDYGVAYAEADRLIVTETMAERKEIMEQDAEAFVALPGGFGTLEEIAQVITLKQLRYLGGPVAFVNTRGFYDGLLAFFEQLYRERFAHAAYRDSYFVHASPAAVLDYIERYESLEAPLKWVGREVRLTGSAGND